MKRLLLLATIASLLFVALLMSCNKAIDYPQNPNVEVSFDVETQINVSKYVIQTSTDGHAFTDRASITADNSKPSITYNGQFYQPGTGHIYLRIKSVDTDGSPGYSPINIFKL